MTTLMFIKCETCKSSYLVGIDGKDIRTSLNQEVDKIENESKPKTFFAIGNDELESCTAIEQNVSCPKCNRICKVYTSKKSEDC